jgi:hypothetical protein
MSAALDARKSRLHAHKVLVLHEARITKAVDYNRASQVADRYLEWWDTEGREEAARLIDRNGGRPLTGKQRKRLVREGMAASKPQEMGSGVAAFLVAVAVQAFISWVASKIIGRLLDRLVDELYAERAAG